MGRRQGRLARIAAVGGLTEVSQDAYEHGLAHLIRVGPFGDVPGVSKLVAVRVLDPLYRQGAMSVALRWEATGATGRLFSVLDADIRLSPAGEHTARLALAGSYWPPLGRIGAAPDKAILNRVATATTHALLHSIADALTSPATARHLADDYTGELAPGPPR